MEIQIDQRFRLVTDKTGWEIQQLRPLTKGERKGTIAWASEGHADTLQHALGVTYQLMLRSGAGKADIAALARRVQEVESRILSAVSRAVPGYAIPIKTNVSPWDALPGLAEQSNAG